jgi:5-methylcytosine-specific restriction enzyme A
MKVPDSIIPEVYSFAKRVFEGKIKRKEAIDSLTSDSKMNPSTVGDLITNFRYFRNGERYERTNNAFAAEYYINAIYKDYGLPGLANALNALKLHIDYYEDLQKITMHKQRKILDKFSKFLTVSPDDIEQSEIIARFKQQKKSKQDIANDLKQIQPSDPVLITISGKAYKRNNKIIASIKFLRDFKCQMCDKFIIKKDGTPYIEAAHIKPKHKLGLETPDNILILCPNHHKEFDLGDLNIIEQTEDLIHLKLNGRDYKLQIGTKF